MAKQSGLGDNFYIGGYDLSGDVGSLDQISGTLATLDVTPINSFGNQRIGGLRDGNMQFTSFFDFSGTASTPDFPATAVAQANAYPFPVLVTISGDAVTDVTINGSSAGSSDGTYVLPALGSITVTYTDSPTWTWTAVGAEHDILSTLPRTDTIASYLRGTTLGNPAYCISGKQVNYDGTRDNNGNLTMKVEVQANGYGGEWGQQLTPGLVTITSGTSDTGTFLDFTAATSFGAQEYIQLVDFVGTDISIGVNTSTTNTGGSGISALEHTFTSGPAAIRLAATGTVDRWNQYYWYTTGGFSLATFAVVFVRNPVAVSF